MAPTIAAVGLPQAKYNVSLVLKNRAHWYDVKSLDGKLIAFLPGVTGVLGVINKTALIPWATKQALLMIEGALKDQAKQKIEITPEWISSIITEAKERPNKIKTEAADLGTMAHQVFDRIVKGEEIKTEDIPEIIRVPVQNFLDWLKQSGIQMIMGDTRIASLREGFGGSLDALGWRDGGYVILDWKTSSGIYNEYALQVSAYATAFEETYGVPVSEGHIIRFDKTKPVFEHKQVSNLTISYGAFRAAKDLQSALKEPMYDE